MIMNYIYVFTVVISPIKVPTGKENAHNIEFYFIHIYFIVTKYNTDQIHPAPGAVR